MTILGASGPPHGAPDQRSHPTLAAAVQTRFRASASSVSCAARFCGCNQGPIWRPQLPGCHMHDHIAQTHSTKAVCNCPSDHTWHLDPLNSSCLNKHTLQSSSSSSSSLWPFVSLQVCVYVCACFCLQFLHFTPDMSRAVVPLLHA